MVWGSISASGRAGIWIMPRNTTMTGPVYLQMLKDKLPIFMSIHGTNHFQHDGAPCHSAKAVKSWIVSSGFQLLAPWPGNSPDLNPIENAWVLMKRAVAAMHPTSLEDLKNKIKQVWISEITPDYCQQLCYSMPARIQAVLDNKGQHTKY